MLGGFERLKNMVPWKHTIHDTISNETHVFFCERVPSCGIAAIALIDFRLKWFSLGLQADLFIFFALRTMPNCTN